MPLTLYRRHIKDCTKGYPQNKRIFWTSDENALKKIDCQCPICAEGKLGKNFLTNKSLKTNDWKTAQDTAAQWEEWGDTKPPEQDGDKNPSPHYAVARFLTSIGPEGRNIEPSTQAQYNVLLNQRLLPWCELKGYTLIREFDDLDTVSKFTESWVNLNPTRNRKNAPMPKEPVPLKNSTKQSQLELLRIFFEFCRDRGWLEHNKAKKIKFGRKTEPKFGMEIEEEQAFWEEVDRFTDGHYRTGQPNATRLKLFCLSLRHAGLRISDGTKLDTSVLVPRLSGEGWAFQLYQKKTKEWVYVPVPAYLEAGLRKLPILGEKDGKRYWFWTGQGKLDTAASNWYMRIMKIVRRVVERRGAFAHPVSPHTFRHTFSIRHLNAGTDIKLVSRWLGHRSTSVTEKHYSHAIKSTKVASEEAYDLSLKRQEEQAAKVKRAKIAVVSN